MNYQLPDKCCYWCEHCYRNDYDDIQCKQPGAPFVVDAGGCCELFVKTLVSNIKAPDIVRRKRTFELFESLKDEPGGTCITCTYSTDTDGTPLCLLTGKVLTDINKGCRKYAQEQEQEINMTPKNEFEAFADAINAYTIDDAQPDSTCVNCKFSALDVDQQPYCQRDGMRIENVNDTCDQWIDECIRLCDTCAYSFYNNGKAWCSNADIEIDASDTCAYWKEAIHVDNA